MRKPALSQEGLKLIACFAMLLDHLGASLVLMLYRHSFSKELYDLYFLLRIIGRIAFPIFCFQLAEGIYHTKNPRKYALRLAIGAVLAEIPFDLLFFGELTWAHSSVMVTLLLAFCWARLTVITEKPGLKVMLLAVFSYAAELLGSDYGGYGVLMVALFVLTRQMPRFRLMQAIGLAVICWFIGGSTIRIGFIRIPIEMFAMFSLIPIFAYSGEKRTASPWIQWAFYLFYPVHLAVLLLIVTLM